MIGVRAAGAGALVRLTDAVKPSLRPDINGLPAPRCENGNRNEKSGLPGGFARGDDLP